MLHLMISKGLRQDKECHTLGPHTETTPTETTGLRPTAPISLTAACIASMPLHEKQGTWSNKLSRLTYCDLLQSSARVLCRRPSAFRSAMLHRMTSP